MNDVLQREKRLVACLGTVPNYRYVPRCIVSHYSLSLSLCSLTQRYFLQRWAKYIGVERTFLSTKHLYAVRYPVATPPPSFHEQFMVFAKKFKSNIPSGWKAYRVRIMLSVVLDNGFGFRYFYAGANSTIFCRIVKKKSPLLHMVSRCLKANLNFENLTASVRTNTKQRLAFVSDVVFKAEIVL